MVSDNPMTRLACKQAVGRDLKPENSLDFSTRNPQSKGE